MLKLEQHKDLILSEIEKGTSLKQLSLELECSVTAVRNVLTKYKPGLRLKTSTPMLKNKAQEIYDEYKQSLNVARLAKKYRCNRDAIKSAIRLIESNINFDITNYSIAKPDYFKTIDTPNKAYILGFIAADGCIVERQGVPTTLTITLHKKDRAVLEFIKTELGIENPIHELPREQVRLVKDLVLDGIEIPELKTLENYQELLDSYSFHPSSRVFRLLDSGHTLLTLSS